MRPSPLRHRLLALAAVGLLAAPSGASAQEELDVPYVPTPPEVVSRMLQLADPAPGDTLYDLGSGDGRIVVTAARRYGVVGVGVELDSARVATSRRKAAEAGVGDRVRFVRGDLFDADLRTAEVVTLYLFPEVNLELRPKLFEQLDPGDRVVSHDFNMGEWHADSVVSVSTPDGGTSTVYYWVMPADAGGNWEVTLGGHGRATIRLDQRYQELRASVPGEGGVTGARVHADTVRFTLRGVFGAGPVRLTGVLRGDRMEGTTGSGVPWTARRISTESGASVVSWEGEGDGSPP